MSIEYEVRILEVDDKALIERLEKLGAKHIGNFEQKRYVFDTVPTVESKWIRLRTNGKTSTLTYKSVEKATIDGTQEIEVEVSDFEKTRELLDSIERMSLLLTEKEKSPIRCRIENGIIKNSCNTSIGQAYDEVTADITGEDLEIGFNNRFMIDALKNTETDEIIIRLNGPFSPILILPSEGDSFTFLVLPVRLKNER